MPLENVNNRSTCNHRRPTDGGKDIFGGLVYGHSESRQEGFQDKDDPKRAICTREVAVNPYVRSQFKIAQEPLNPVSRWFWRGVFRGFRSDSDLAEKSRI